MGTQIPVAVPARSFTYLDDDGKEVVFHVPERLDYFEPISVVPESLDEVKESFQLRLKDYLEAVEKDEDDEVSYRPGKVSDCVDKLIDTITLFGEMKMRSPNLYSEIVELQAFKSMVELLKSDGCGEALASSILLTFEELTDTDILEDDQEAVAAKFADLLVDYGAVEVFASVLGRYSDVGIDDDFDDIEQRALQTIAQMMFVKPDVAEIVCKQTKLLSWVVDNVRMHETCDFRKQYAVGFLETLLESSTTCVFELGEMGVVDVLANSLLPYTSLGNDKSLTVEEEDMLEEVFLCLSCLLWFPKNRVRLANAGGVHHLIEITKQKKLYLEYYGSALVALNTALKDCPAACDKFLDASGLDIAFLASKIRPCHTHEKEEIEELLVSVIASLTGGITDENKKDMLLSKFEENDFSKTTWLMELFNRYLNQVKAGEKKVADMKEEGLELVPADQPELYNEYLLRYGLSTLQLIAVILGYLWLSKKSEISAKIEEELSRLKFKKKDVLDYLLRYRESIVGMYEGESAENLAAMTAGIDKYIGFLEVTVQTQEN